MSKHSPTRPPALSPGAFPPHHPSPVDHLGRLRAAFERAGWRVLPGYLPRVNVTRWWERRGDVAGVVPARTPETPARTLTAEALPPDAFAGVVGPDRHRTITAMHPALPLAVTAQTLKAGHDLDFTLWWEGGYATEATGVPDATRVEVATIIDASIIRD